MEAAPRVLPDGVTPMTARWVAILRGESALALPQRAGGACSACCRALRGASSATRPSRAWGA